MVTRVQRPDSNDAMQMMPAGAHNREITMQDRNQVYSAARPISRGHTVRRLGWLGVGLFLAIGGCSPYVDDRVPDRIRPGIEPRHGGEYLLYRPSSYDREMAWPLVIVCHTTWPDSPNEQIRRWTELAEGRGFLVVAPKLKGVSRLAPPSASDQIELQRRDERHILGVMNHVRAGHNISNDRIFLHGYSGGAYAALHTGLRHPERFRAVSLYNPQFEEGYLADVSRAIDANLPVFVTYTIDDVLKGKDGEHCCAWLRGQGANLIEDEVGPKRGEDARRVVSFYEDTLRRRPWVHIRALPAESDPLTVRFKLESSTTPTQYRWRFGDGEEAPVAEPIHTYAEPGSYRVTATVSADSGTPVTRSAIVEVPNLRIRPAND